MRRLSAFAVAASIGLSGFSSSAAVRPPKLQYELSTLPNGLTLVLSEDHSTPIVHLQLWYHVGSKNESPGRTGFAHLFEHLMFKGSRNVESEGHTSQVSSVGGQANAYTEDDVTVFWETVPAQYLPLVLWLEADRMASLRITKETFTNEREVVKEERRMRVDNQPYGRLNEIIYDQAFTTHPYKHATIGSMKDLETASVEDVRDFYNTYYVPANATLALVGDFDAAQAKELVNEYLGRVPKAERPVPRDIPKEPPQTKERRVTLEEPWPLPAVVVAHHALIAELERLKAEPISDHELQRTKNQFARDYIVGRETDQQKAAQLAHALVIHHDITTADGEFDIFQNITTADVQRVARTYFTSENRLVITLMPAKPGAGAAGPR
jgi:zinc protease